MNKKPIATLAAAVLLSASLFACGPAPSSSSASSSSAPSSSSSSSAHEHAWGTPTYTWSESLDACTAKRVCADDPTHIETEQGTVSSSVTVQPTCAKEGTRRYTASFQNPAFQAQVKEEPIAKLAHSWDEGRITRYPTILAAGEKTYTCAVGGETKVEPVAKVTDATSYTLNASAMEGLTGVYGTKAVVGADKASATIGIPVIAKQNLADYPTYDSPAIIQGAAVGYETKTGATEYTPIPGKELLAPYSYFRWSVTEQKSTSADGQVTIHKKLTGFDGTYYIVRIDVSDIIAGKTGYLHVLQEENKALMVALGMGGGIDTGEPATDAEGKATTAPTIVDGTWHVGTKDTGIAVAPNHTASQAYAGTNGNWFVGGYTFGFGTGSKAGSYTIADNGAALKDQNGNYMDAPYIDVILLSSSKLAAGADTGKTGAPSSDIPVSFYVDDTFDYNPSLVYDPTSTDPNHATEVAKKYFDATKAVEGTNATSYIVKGGDLEIDIATQETQNADEVVEYWSLDKAINYPAYNAHTLKLICEVPVLEGLTVSGVDGKARSITLDVNSFDIQIANHTQTGAAGLVVEDKATLTLLDHSNTAGAELAVGNNAKMEIKSGGTLVIDRTCQLEVEYDAASKVVPTEPIAVSELITKIDALPAASAVTEANRVAIEEAKALYDLLSEGDKALVGADKVQHLNDCVAALPEETPLANGEIIVRDGGKIVNKGIVNIEGLEGKPNQGNPGETGQSVVRDMRAAALVIETGGNLDNYGCLSVKGDLHVLGTVTNYGAYDTIIQGTDPDKGIVDHHCGIQITWKDDVTLVDPNDATKYIVNPDIRPGTVHVGEDTDGTLFGGAQLINYGDIVLVPGTLTTYATVQNAVGTDRAGAIYLCTVTEAVVPITPTPEDPTKLEERRTIPAYGSTFDYDMGTFVNNGTLGQATVEIIGNGLFGKLTPIQAQ